MNHKLVASFALLASVHEGLGFNCPYPSGYFSDPDDCASFYQCYQGTSYKKSCPSGLLYNAAAIACDWPANVNCNSNSQPTTAPPAPVSTTQPTTKSQGGSGYTCPASSGYFADPDDCASFYQCYQGTAYKKSCPSGLLYNAAAIACDWPANVNCDSNSQPTTAAPPAPITTQATTQRPGPIISTTSQYTTSGPSSISCNTQTSEPINDEIRKYRKLTCTAPNSVVEGVRPGSSSNPANVKVVEAIFPESSYKSTFPRADPAYTYANFLKAFAKFPAVCVNEVICRKTLAAMFAHFDQETAGLFYLKEINRSPYCATWSDWVVKAYPCAPGQMYFGRGSKQLSWNYNYGAFSQAMFGDAQILLKNPDLVSDTWLNFAAGIWFFVTPQPPKPSMLAVLDGSWQPNSHDLAGNKKPGFGATTMIINGAQECGSNPPNSNGATNRANSYKKYAAQFKVDISGEKLDCRDMTAFDEQGSSNPSLYWSAETCTICKWQTAFSTLVEGDYQRCKNQ